MQIFDDTVIYIYALIDPRTDQIRYVGQAVNVRDRLRYHIKDKAKTHKTNWIKEVRAAGHRPTYRILEQVNGANCSIREQYWIAHLKEQGVNLVNGTAGGEGTRNRVWTEEQRAVISRLHKGRKLTQEHITNNLCAKKERRDERIANGTLPMQNRSRNTYLLISPEGEEALVTNLSAHCKTHLLHVPALVNVAKGRNRHHKGWKCFLLDNDGNIVPPIVERRYPSPEEKLAHMTKITNIARHKNLRHRNIKINLYQPKTSTKYIVVSPAGDEIAVENMSLFCRQHELSQPAMANVLCKANKQHKGWTARYV